MSWKLVAQVIVAIGLAAVGSTVCAQSVYDSNRNWAGDPRPRNPQSGYSGSEMRSIYAQDIGRGYTGQSLNSIALESARARVGYFGQGSAGQSSSIGGSLSPSPQPRLGKPFASVSQAPTTSPYLNLFREGIGEANDFDYQTLVRPQIQQQQMNQQFERQQLDTARRVQKIAAQTDYKNPAGAEDQYPTGHHTAFGQYGHFYPTINQTVRKKN